jgi:cytochrome c oxidase assembly protein subunit 11
MTVRKNTIQKNTRTGLAILLVVLVMVGMSFAAVPLYRIFCQSTGFGGTTQVSLAAPAKDKIVNRIITVKLTGNVARDMPWRFAPQQREIAVKLGQKVKINFNAENRSGLTITGTAVHNVTPNKAGVYFKKIQCFCFTDQVLKPHEKAVLPVIFFVDPALDKDRGMDDVTTITLSYTFFNKSSSDLDKSIEDFYNAPVAASSESKTAGSPSVR